MTLPTSYSWSLPFSAVSPSVSVVPVFPVGTMNAPLCDGIMYDSEYFLSMFDRRLPYDYLQPLKVNTNSGYELFRAAAAVFERVSQAVERLECGSIIMFSWGGTQAEVEVEFSRPTAAAGAVTLAANTIVSCSRSGRLFYTLTDAVFGALDIGPVAVTARALANSWQYNVAGKTITPVSAITLEGEVDTILRAIQIDPATGLRDFLDATLEVQNIDPGTGGRDAMLDGLGSDRGVIRAPSEGDDVYRYRVRSLPDTVSPAAIIRVLENLKDAWGVTYQFVEVGDRAYQTAFDFPSQNAGTPSYQTPYPAACLPYENVFTYDDPRPAYPPFTNRWLDDVEFRAAFFVVVSLPQAIAEYGMHYDSVDVTPADRETLNGVAAGFFAISAFDIPSGLDSAAGVAGCYDGSDPGLNGFWYAWWTTLQTLKAAGVAAILESQGN